MYLALRCPGAGRGQKRRRSRARVPKVPHLGPGGSPVTFVPGSRDEHPWRRVRCRGNGEIVIEEVVMTATMHEPSTAEPDRDDIAGRLLVPAFWGAVSIVARWLAVLFDGIF